MQSQACLSFAGANGHDTMHPSIHRLGITFVLEPLGISLFHSSFRSFSLLQCWLFCDRMMFIGCKDKYLSCNLQESLAISIMDVSFFFLFFTFSLRVQKIFLSLLPTLDSPKRVDVTRTWHLSYQQWRTMIQNSIKNWSEPRKLDTT